MSNLVSQKCYYGIKAVFELARANSDGPIKIGYIAERQNIPIRFLEAILRQLRQAGFVDSRRGAEGGYLLARRPSQIRVGEIIGFFEGRFDHPETGDQTPPAGDETDWVLNEVWRESRQAVMNVFNNWTIQDLVDKAEYVRNRYSMNFSI